MELILISNTQFSPLRMNFFPNKLKLRTLGGEITSSYKVATELLVSNLSEY